MLDLTDKYTKEQFAMKIKEIINDDIDLSEIINITESFNAQFNKLDWSRNGTTVIGIGILNDDEFILEIGLQSITIDNKTFKYVTIEFYKIDEGIPTQKLTAQNTSQSSIFGCIKNAFYNKITALDKQFNIDAIVTLVKTDIDNKPQKRVRLYKNMFSKNQGNTEWNWIHDFQFKNLLGSIFTKHQISISMLNQLKQSISNHSKENL